MVERASCSALAGQPTATSLWASLDDLLTVHGYSGWTTVEWIDRDNGQDARVEPWRTEALIDLLDDPSAREDERDDAVIALRSSDDPRVRAILLRVAVDPHTEYLVAASAGESLGEIAARTTVLHAAQIDLLRADARKEYDAAYRQFASPSQHNSAP